jgi:DNA polymerase-3 subunit delta
MSGKTQDLKPVYLILSTQPMLVEQALTRLRSRVAEVADLDFNFQAFDGENTDVDEVISAANTLPFASEHRLVIVRNIEKLNKDGLDALAAYVADPSPTTVLALVGEKLAKNTRLFKAVDKTGGVLERSAPKGRELIGSVRSMFADRGRTLDIAGAELLVQSVGKDLQRISVEIDKTIAYAGDRTAITRDDIDSIVASTAATSVFEFTEALGDRDCRRALTLLDGLLRDGGSTELGVHVMAVRAVRDLITARSLLDRGQGSSVELARVLGRQEWQIRKLPKQARSFRSEELVEMLKSAACTEAQMKTSRDSRLALERWVVQVCGD